MVLWPGDPAEVQPWFLPGARLFFLFQVVPSPAGLLVVRERAGRAPVVVNLVNLIVLQEAAVRPSLLIDMVGLRGVSRSNGLRDVGRRVGLSACGWTCRRRTWRGV